MMNIYLLDTNIISEPSKIKPNQNIVEKIAENIEYSCICSIVWAESLAGVALLDNGRKKDSLFHYLIDTVQKNFEMINFDASCATVYADLVKRLKEKGSPLPKFDLLITSAAITNNLILVTQNTKDFLPITELSTLMLENWAG